ncbi:hypothetical protein OPAG_02235 [Rhodococcus opacus PD630]|nr:hypothetical protein OPAG_02235 [Rhodococcus opacus PD630]
MLRRTCPGLLPGVSLCTRADIEIPARAPGEKKWLAATSYIRGTAYGVTPANFTHSSIDARAQRWYSPTKICQLIEQTSPMPS